MLSYLVVNLPAAQSPPGNADSQLPTIEPKVWKAYSDRCRKNNPATVHQIISPAMNSLGSRSVWPASSDRSYEVDRSETSVMERCLACEAGSGRHPAFTCVATFSAHRTGRAQ